MEQEPHSIITENIRSFKKLRRQFRALERQDKEMEPELLQRMLALDEWLACNCPEWHQNYPTMSDEGL